MERDATSVMDVDPYAKARYHGGPVHAVVAAGTARDGSLYGFPTLCGLVVSEIAAWAEVSRESGIECGTCTRAAAAQAASLRRPVVGIFPPALVERDWYCEVCGREPAPTEEMESWRFLRATDGSRLLACAACAARSGQGTAGGEA